MSVRSSGLGVGEFELTTPAAATIDELVMLKASWVHPVRWLNLSLALAVRLKGTSSGAVPVGAYGEPRQSGATRCSNALRRPVSYSL
jgi:hypothetical protein